MAGSGPSFCSGSEPGDSFTVRFAGRPRGSGAAKRTVPPPSAAAGAASGIDVALGRRPSSEPRPGLLWIHGGGYILGSAEDERARTVAERLDCAVVSVDYRLAPEHPFPAGPEDCYAALQWMVGNADALEIDAARLAIGGASAGGGMAAGVALMNRDRGGPDLAKAGLEVPDCSRSTQASKCAAAPTGCRWRLRIFGPA